MYCLVSVTLESKFQNYSEVKLRIFCNPVIYGILFTVTDYLFCNSLFEVEKNWTGYFCR